MLAKCSPPIIPHPQTPYFTAAMVPACPPAPSPISLDERTSRLVRPYRLDSENPRKQRGCAWMRQCGWIEAWVPLFESACDRIVASELSSGRLPASLHTAFAGRGGLPRGSWSSERLHSRLLAPQSPLRSVRRHLHFALAWRGDG